MRKTFRWDELLVLMCLVSGPAWAEKTLILSLHDAEELGLKNSDNLKAQENVTESSERSARVGKSYLYPRLSIDGYYYNNSVLPDPQFGAASVTFGAHNNWSIGPMLSYNLFDGGKLRKSYSSLLSVNQAKVNDEKSRRKYLLYQTRLAYFNLQYAIQSLKYTAASVKLTQDQGNDISNKYKTGSSSRLDYISAQKDIINYKIRFETARKNISVATREMLAITKQEDAFDTSSPMPEDLVEKLPKDLGEPSLILKVDEITRSIEYLSRFEKAPTPVNHPELESLNQMYKANVFSSESYHSGFYPNVTVYVKSMAQYPNVVVKEQIQQNTFGVNLSFPIFEGDLTRNQTQMAKAQALTYEYQRRQRKTDLDRDWIKFHDNLKILKTQLKLARSEREAAHEIRQLTFSSYKNGKSRYLDVQNANLRELESRLTEADLESQILAQYSGLDYLSEDH